MILSVVWVAGLATGSWYMARFRRLPSIDRHDCAERSAAADVTIVIPARNEAVNLTGLIPSVPRTSSAVCELIVVDDASTDDTAIVARAHGASVLRLDGEPPRGWTGKAYACQRGADAATGRVLLFLDADVRLHDGAIDRLVAALDRRGGLVSVQPFHDVRRPYEQLSSVCNAVSMMGSGAFAAWPRPRRPVAFGPCLATTRAEYVTVGGHRSVAGEVVEDVQLARRYAAHGLPTTVFAGSDAVSFRMYPDGVRQLLEGWTKNLTSGAGLVDPVAALVATWWVTSCLALGIRAIDVLIGAYSDPWALLVAAACWMTVTLQLRWVLARIGAFRWWTAVLHPIALWAFVGMFLRSAWLTLVRRKVRWSGRDITLTERAG
jgi:4,4'-diaponeurosporenoate glycosyltransferase